MRISHESPSLLFPRANARCFVFVLLVGYAACPHAIAATSNAQAATVQGANAELNSSAVAADAWSAARHDALVEAVRGGNTPPGAALATLKRWYDQRLPDLAALRRVASDGIVWAVQADDVQQALRWSRTVPTRLIADYALPSAFRAARTAPDRAAEAEFVAQMRTRNPADWRPRQYEVLWQLDRGDIDAAQRAVDALAPPATGAQEPARRIAWIEARAAVAVARGDGLQAIAAYAELSALDPSQRYATRENAFLLSDRAAPTAAFAQAQAAEAARPGTFGALEMARLQQQALGQRLRWAQAERDQRVGQGPARFEALDALLPLYDDALKQAQQQEAQQPAPPIARTAGSNADPGTWRAVRLQLSYDRITALAARGRAADVVQSFEALRAEGIAPPYYVLSSAAGAYQQMRRSDLAVPLYEAALRDAGGRLPLPSDTHFGLVYAYLDTARFEDADALLQKLEAATPPMLRLTPEQGRANPQYGEVRNLRALYQLYTDDTARAERSFDALAATAPLNAGFRAGQAETARLRSHPDAALARYEETLTDHPTDVPTRAGYASTLLEAGRIGEGRVLIDSLQAEAPESITVRNAVQQRDAVLAPRLEIEGDAGRDGGALANNEWRLDSRLSSGLMQDHWRVFYHQVFARGDTNIGDVKLVRGGLGVQWQNERWQLSGEVNQANDGPYRTGVTLGARWRASDYWRFAAELDTNSLDTPWKARATGVGAHALALSSTFVANESRSIEGRWQRMDFSDGNVRDALGVSWRERWIATPRFQLESTLGAESGRSDRQDVAYFSPSRESAVQLGLAARYLTWKRDDRRFTQVVEVSGGSYHQANFGSDPLWSVRYSHEWELGPSLLFRYGIGVSSHPYDGVRERRKFVFFNVSVPLK